MRFTNFLWVLALSYYLEIRLVWFLGFEMVA
jgi:hypothetical protein